MIHYIAKSTFNYITRSQMGRKAVAMAIYLKNRNRTSVFKDWSYRSIASETGLSPNTVKRYLQILHRLHLVRDWEASGHRYLEFKKLRKKKIRNRNNDRFHTPKFSDISLKDIDLTDVKAIEKELAALVLKDYAHRTSRMRQLIKLGTDPKPATRDKVWKRAAAICREQGYKEFVEWGLSYSKITKRLHCSPNTAKKVITIGESLGLFEVVKRDLVLVQYAGYGKAKQMLKNVRYAIPNAFATKSNIYYRPALIFLPTEKVKLWV